MIDVSGDWDGMTRGWGRVGWAPLKGCLLKCNVDYACFQQEGATGYVVVVRDSMGYVLKGFSSFFLCSF